MSHREQVVSECAICFLLNKGCSFAATKKKALPLHTKKTQKRRSLSVLNPNAKREWVVGDTRLPSYPPPQKKKYTRYPLHMRLCGPWGPSGWIRKISPHRGSNPGTPQSATSHYTDYVISAPVHLKYFYKVPVTGGGGKLP